MSIKKSEAIILKTYNFRETSLIVNFFTKDFGKIRGIIKGIRNKPQRYGGWPLVSSRSSIVFYEGAKKNLNLVTQCDIKEQFLPIRTDLQKLNYANYFIELLDAVTEDFDKNTKLFDLILHSLRALCCHQESWHVARIFEIKLLNLSGFKPRLDACVHCQKEIPGQGKFSTALGGILCQSCLRFDRRAREILPGTLASIVYFEKSSWSKAFYLKIAPNIAIELAAILSSFLNTHIDKKIKSQRYII
jgi:DNA repair protein RecO (recombination protein O)